MPTIYTSRKLEKLVKKFIIAGASGDAEKLLSSFYAELITIHRKRCWIVIHELSLFCVLLPNMTGARVKNATQILAKAFENQLRFEGILPLEGEVPEDLRVGLLNPAETIQLASTNANRKTTGYLRDRIENLKYREEDYPNYESYPFEHEAGVLNRYPSFGPTDKSKLVQGNVLMCKHLGVPTDDYINGRTPFPGQKQQSIVTKEQRYQADMYYYDALEASTEADFRQNLQRALALHPKHISSRLLLLEERSAIEQFVNLPELLEDAEQELGKKFNELKGAFWGFSETRPYMRVRYAFANLLSAYGRTELAISHWQEMLLLNPNDNQGVRYDLAAAYLLENDLKAFQKLYASYIDEQSAHWAWYRVFYGVLGEEPEIRLEPLLKDAQEKNPYMMPLLKVGKPSEAKLPDSYIAGSEIEALVIMNDIWPLLRKKQVKTWLKGQ